MIPNVSSTPRVWTNEELIAHAQTALDEFVERRLAEPGGQYLAHVKARRSAIFGLFKALAGVDPDKPDPKIIRKVVGDQALFDSLRYVAGPPVSEDDFGVLVTRRVEGISRKELAASDELPVSALKLICKLSDPIRFPWIATRRRPSARELRRAIDSTTTMHAAQALQTERRGHGKEVEHRLEDRLRELGFVKVSGGLRKPKKGQPPAAPLPAYPPKGRITQPSHHPTYPHFYGECTVYGRKVDLFIALQTGRMVALEAKDSSSALNSTKRLLNDTAAKAKHYASEGGKNIISVAMLSGVFKIADLKAAQEFGLYLVWAHDLDGFVEWIKSQN